MSGPPSPSQDVSRLSLSSVYGNDHQDKVLTSYVGNPEFPSFLKNAKSSAVLYFPAIHSESVFIARFSTSTKPVKEEDDSVPSGSSFSFSG